jgi:hypothetical protein
MSAQRSHSYGAHRSGEAIDNDRSTRADDHFYATPRCFSREGCHRYFCPEHYEREAKRCDVCHNRSWAGASLGAYNHEFVGEFRFCWEHELELCGLRYRIDGEEYSSEDESDEEVITEVCHFNCCPDCLDGHVCGDDPHLYL